MALFAGKLHDEIADLNEELDASDETIAALSAQVERLAAELEASQEVMRQAARAHEVQVANLLGQIEGFKVDGAKYRALVQGHHFHNGGSAVIDGRAHRLMEARTDNPQATVRILVPEGVDFP